MQLGFGQGLTMGVAVLGGISILAYIISQSNRESYYPLLGFVPSYVFGKMMIWQFITANFMHGNLTHLLFNMFGFYMFGNAVEKRIGERWEY